MIMVTFHVRKRQLYTRGMFATLTPPVFLASIYDKRRVPLPITT
jgi:hypothetical protein